LRLIAIKSGEKRPYKNLSFLLLAMESKDASSSSVDIKNLDWNSGIDSEEVFDTTMSGFRTTLIKESLLHLLTEADASRRLKAFPLRINLGSNVGRESYQKRVDLFESSLNTLNDEAMKAMGSLMAMFRPECNAHRSLNEWFSEDVTSQLHIRDQGRRDFNFRHAWSRFYEEYEPNQEVNLDSITKKWEALTDENISFAQFHGKYQKYVKEMEKIGRPPTLAKMYEVLRSNVKNEHLTNLVQQLSLAEARRISIDDFFEDANMYTRLNKHLDSGPKRKAEVVLGKAASIGPQQKKMKTGGKYQGSKVPNRSPKLTCWRCGRRGHRVLTLEGAKECVATTCEACKKSIGAGNHDARTCVEGGARGVQQGQRSVTLTAGENKKFPKTAWPGRGVEPTTSMRSESSGGVPQEVINAMAVIDRFHKKTVKPF
jgi:hypothetical protein